MQLYAASASVGFNSGASAALQGLQGLHGFEIVQGLQGFLAAHGLHGFFAAQGLHGLQGVFTAAHGLAAARRGTVQLDVDFAAQGFLAAHGLHGFFTAHGFFAAHGLQGFFTAHGFFFTAHGLAATTISPWLNEAALLATLRPVTLILAPIVTANNTVDFKSRLKSRILTIPFNLPYLPLFS